MNIFMWKQVLLEWNTTGPDHLQGGKPQTVHTSWLIVIYPKQLNSPVFTETRTLNLQRTPSLRLLSILLQTGSAQLGSTLKGLPDGRPSLWELLLRSFSQFYQVMAGGFYPPSCKSTRRYGGQAGGWLIHCRQWLSAIGSRRSGPS